MTRSTLCLRLVFALALALFVPQAALADDSVPGPVTHDPSDDPDPEFPPPDDDPADSAHVQQKLAAKFGVDESQIASLRGERLGYGEIDHALTLAERMPGGITDENVAQVLEMRQDQGMGWGQIAHTQGTTLGKAKQEFPTQPPVVEPPPEPAPTTGAAALQPKSLSRPGKSALAASANGGSAKAHGSKSAAQRGSSNRSVRSMTASTSPARAGHAYGKGGSSGGAKVGGNGNGKAKGRNK